MKVEKYILEAGKQENLFEFISVGPKGNITKLIEFQPTDIPDLYNLAFGDKNVITGEIDDLIISDNGDTDKVLATVIDALYIFLYHNPNALVYARGSTMARTRLYRMGITRFFETVSEDFYLFGQTGDDFVEFEKGINYNGFLVQRKFD